MMNENFIGKHFDVLISLMIFSNQYHNIPIAT